MSDQIADKLFGEEAAAGRLGLPRETDSICPECLKVIKADLYEEGGKVYMKKACPDHGEILDLIASRADLFLMNERRSIDDSVRIENPVVESSDNCPSGCGLCGGHLSSASMTNLDLTNRCNLRCPFCFANANIQDHVYEPDLEQIRQMMDSALSIRPKRMQAIQFSGGEPTLSPHFLGACRLAKDRGIKMIQVATNGIRFAKDEGFARDAAAAGLNAAYLQFDGLGDEIHYLTRGVRGLWNVKLKALDVCKKYGIRVTLVPTMVKGINDHMAGDILKFAISNMDAVVGVAFQPVSFTGRIDQSERLRQRYTFTHLTTDIEEQSGCLRAADDWYPYSVMGPFSRVIDNVLGTDSNGYYSLHCNSHPDCGLSAFLLVNQRTGKTVPLGQVIDTGAAIAGATNLAVKTEKKRSRLYTTALVFSLLMKIYRPESAPKGLGVLSLAKTIDAISGKRLLGIAKKRRYEWRLLLISSMHFQDAYNYQVDRVRRCTIHYATPGGKIYPFCTYNSGICFRGEVEREHSIPKSEWVCSRGGQFVTDGFVE